MTPIERAARALCKMDGNPENIKFQGNPMWQSYVPQAISVVDALHEPSQVMRESGAEIVRALCPEHSYKAAEDDAVNIWRMMIDAMRRDVP